MHRFYLIDSWHETILLAKDQEPVQRLHLQIFSLIIVCGLLSTACSEKTVPAGPKFKGRVIFLSGESASEKDLVEVTAGPNDTFTHTKITSGVFEAAANPDQTQLIYATKDEIVLRDLRSNEVKPLIKGQSFCLAWSPDSKRFSYKQRGARSIELYASDLNGQAKLLWEDVRANSGAANQTTFPPHVDVGCAHWVAPDKLIFVRFGPSQKLAPDTKPNTTTLATVSDSVKLVDTEKKWSVEGVCKTGTAFLRSSEGQILIAKSLENLKTANPTSGPCAGCRFLGFAAQSCFPFFLEENSRDSSDLFSLNPTNWQRLKGGHIGQSFSPAARMLINSSTRLMVVGDEPATLLLVNTESGDTTSLASKSDAAQLRSPVPVVWIEK
ncbi:MAG TPA: hypothetical protein VJT71_05170 [Pyrinomonadaceae bacterium]|nr:hypothetical protein [Pyrinomonadaceae bacterium]